MNKNILAVLAACLLLRQSCRLSDAEILLLLLLLACRCAHTEEDASDSEPRCGFGSCAQ